MARPSEELYDLGKFLWETIGWGNENTYLPLLVAVLISLLLLTGVYFPAFATASEWIFGGSIFLGTFGFLSLADGKLNAASMLFGLIVGVVAAAIAIAACSLGVYIAPAIAALLVLPNVLTLACLALSMLCKIPEAIFDGLSYCFNCLCCCCKRDSAIIDSPKTYNPTSKSSNYQIQQDFTAANPYNYAQYQQLGNSDAADKVMANLAREAATANPASYYSHASGSIAHFPPYTQQQHQAFANANRMNFKDSSSIRYGKG